MLRISDLIRNKPGLGDNDGSNHRNTGNREPSVRGRYIVSTDAKVLDIHEEQHKDPEGCKVIGNMLSLNCHFLLEKNKELTVFL